MNTAALIIAAGLPMYDGVPAAMFKVGSVSTAEHMIASFEKLGAAALYLVTDETTKKLEKQLSSTSCMFIRCKGNPLEAAKQAIVSLPKHYDRILVCCGDRPLVLPASLKKLLSSHGDVTALSFKGVESPFCIMSMEAAEIFCADTQSKSFAEAFSNLGFEKRLIEQNDPGLVTRSEDAAKDETVLLQHQNALTRPVIDVQIHGEQMILEPRLIKLLRLVNSLHSVRDACEMLGISYSIAWNLLNSAEDQLGYALIRRNQGGRSGPGSELTEKGRKLLNSYDGFEAELNKQMQAMFDEYFADIL